MEDVLDALGDAQYIAGFARYLAGVPPRYRPGGSNPVGFWKWFISTARSFAAMETPSAVEDGCRHGLADGQCSQCLPRAEFDALEAF
jgi:hypothetical protein